jgi:hypothetical protein
VNSWRWLSVEVANRDEDLVHNESERSASDEWLPFASRPLARFFFRVAAVALKSLLEIFAKITQLVHDRIDPHHILNV